MLKAVIVGAGHRAMGYAEYAVTHPDELRIVGVADPLPERRKMVRDRFGVTEERCFENAEALVKAEKFADCAINGTMDRDHVPTTLALLAAGYDVLLEKPFAVSEEEVTQLGEAVRRSGRKVMICHVLRYAPFYVGLKRRVVSGEIGDIIDIQTAEHVSYHHYSTAFSRGKWNSLERCGSSFLMSKCCHDLDLIAWFKSGIAPVRISSFGGLRYFTREFAPEGAGECCLLDCPIEAQCDYSVRKLYLNHPDRWTFYVWPELEHQDRSPAAKEARLRDPSNPYARCMWKQANTVTDRQIVGIEFADGGVATHSLVGGTARAMRKIHLIGTRGELEGVFDDNRFVVRHIDSRPGHEYTEEVVDLAQCGDTSGAFGGHGGGDLRLIADFVALLNGKEKSISCTELADSISGHMIGFSADRAMREGRVVSLV